MRQYLPDLATLWRFADRIPWLFDTPKDLHHAGCRRSAILRDPTIQAVPGLVKAMEKIDPAGRQSVRGSGEYRREWVEGHA
jgi:hypothetical protein